MSRLLIVSNRLPVTVSIADGETHVVPSMGGLATGLRGPHERTGGLWIGWPGQAAPGGTKHRAELTQLLAEHRTVPVWLTRSEVTHFYEDVSNGVIWPLFHYLIDQMPLRVQHWDVYESANAHFAEAVVAQYRPGDRIWVHDYQLMLLPALLRRRLPDAQIGFFLHIPFPAHEVFATMPAREAVLRGLLGADLVGFHTPSYARHFLESVSRVLRIPTGTDAVEHDGHTSRVEVFPMGVDAVAYGARAARPEVDAELAALTPAVTAGRDVALFVGIDRLDYTKGIPRRLLAFEQLLIRHPELRERVRLIQVAVPSRTAVGAYQKFRHELDALVGRINGAFGTPRWTPVHYLYRSVPDSQLLALYRAAQVMLVTPVRDGMNLVAKEFVACRADEDGVLVLSEFVGAAAELSEALCVNPYDVDGAAATYYRALTMPREERQRRMRAMRTRVRSYDVHVWADSFLASLDAPPDAAGRP